VSIQKPLGPFLQHCCGKCIWFSYVSVFAPGINFLKLSGLERSGLSRSDLPVAAPAAVRATCPRHFLLLHLDKDLSFQSTRASQPNSSVDSAPFMVHLLSLPESQNIHFFDETPTMRPAQLTALGATMAATITQLRESNWMCSIRLTDSLHRPKYTGYN
jgi:hypothetical protein